ncbi:hypothetical protein [Bacteroides finegoldii]|uniref:hypothetical protein n=1 Tax=Bacteroides finegoldii TaxID=338188 RepID=UPI00242AA2D9|nr:hypothetical protein [Bacteroides finegoldii]
MKDIIELLQKERIKTVDALKNGNKQELSYLQQIDKALGWLKLIEEKGLENVGCYDIHSLPDLPPKSRGIYNYYHLMMDYEDPSFENWREYKPDGQPLLLMYDDIVITRKGR